MIRVLDLCQNFLAQTDLSISMDVDMLVDIYITHIAMKILQLSTSQSDSGTVYTILLLIMTDDEIIDVRDRDPKN